MRRIGLVLHPRRDTREVVESLRAWADQAGAEVIDAEELGDGCDLLVAVGGDGTVLGALALGAPRGVPVLGVNLGRLGYLTEIEAHELDQAMSAIENGNYAVEERAVLRVIPREGCPLAETSAYNDFVLTRQPGRGQAGLELIVDGELFARYSVDAVVVSTPTGSTAYNFSAGGPIVSPRLAGLLVTPVAPHASFNRALVLSPHEQVELRVLPESHDLHVEVDGRSVGTTPPGSRIDVALGDHPGLVVRLGHLSFAARARQKLRLADPRE